MNSKQRNLIKIKIQELEGRNISLKTSMIIWIVLAVLLFFTIVVPFISIGYYKKNKEELEENKKKIEELRKQIS